MLYDRDHRILLREYRSLGNDYRLVPCAAMVWAVSAFILWQPHYAVIILCALIIAAILILIWDADYTLWLNAFLNIYCERVFQWVSFHFRLNAQSHDSLKRKTSEDLNVSLRYTFLAVVIVSLAAGWHGYFYHLQDRTEEFMQIVHPIAITGYLDNDPIYTGNEHSRILPFHTQISDLDTNHYSGWININIIFSDESIVIPQRGSRIALTVKPYKYSRSLVELIRIDKVLDSPAPYIYCANFVREKFHSAATHIGGDIEQLLSAFILGDQRFIPYHVKQDFVDSGLIHLMVFSGANFSVIISFFLSVLMTLRMNKRICIGFSIAIIMAIVIIVGEQPAVLRAAIMSAITVCALVSSRSRAPVGVLCATVVILLFLFPEYAIDLGFSLSVAATGGIIMGIELMENYYSCVFDARFLRLRNQKIAKLALLVQPLALSTSATFAVSPILFFIGGKSGFGALLSNLCVEPIMPLIIIPGVVIACTCLISISLGSLCMGVIDPLIQYIAIIAHYSAQLSRNNICGWLVNFPVLLIAAIFIIYRVGKKFANELS